MSRFSIVIVCPVGGVVGEVLGDVVLDPQLAALLEQQDRRRRELLGDRAELEHHLGSHRPRELQVGHAVPLAEHDLAVLDDDRGRPRLAGGEGGGERLVGVGGEVHGRRGVSGNGGQGGGDQQHAWKAEIHGGLSSICFGANMGAEAPWGDYDEEGGKVPGEEHGRDTDGRDGPRQRRLAVSVPGPCLVGVRPCSALPTRTGSRSARRRTPGPRGAPRRRRACSRPGGRLRGWRRPRGGAARARRGRGRR